MKTKNVDWKIIVAAMGGITVLEIVAILQGIDGILLTTVIATLAGLAGYVIKSPIKLK